MLDHVKEYNITSINKNEPKTSSNSEILLKPLQEKAENNTSSITIYSPSLIRLIIQV